MVSWANFWAVQVWQALLIGTPEAMVAGCNLALYAATIPSLCGKDEKRVQTVAVAISSWYCPFGHISTPLPVLFTALMQPALAEFVWRELPKTPKPNPTLVVSGGARSTTGKKAMGETLTAAEEHWYTPYCRVSPGMVLPILPAQVSPPPCRSLVCSIEVAACLGARVPDVVSFCHSVCLLSARVSSNT